MEGWELWTTPSYAPLLHDYVPVTERGLLCHLAFKSFSVPPDAHPFCPASRQMLCYGRRIPTEELQRRIMNTTRQDVIRTMHEYIYDREVALAGVGKHL